MVWPAVQELRAFYRTPLGALICRHVRSVLHTRWPEVGSGARLSQPEYIASVGFAHPYLLPLLRHSEEEQSSYIVFSQLPAGMGGYHWPKDKYNAAILVQEDDLPLQDASIDRMVLVHALEFAPEPEHFMREIWRVLKPEGKLIVVVPNRSSVWARSEVTPFGFGRPFSSQQLEQLMTDSMFTIDYKCSQLFGFPSQSKWVLRINGLLEPLGERWGGMMGGLLFYEVTKQLYASGLVVKNRRKAVFAAVGDR